MTKSELVDVLAQKIRHLSRMEVEVIVDTIFNGMKQSLVRLHRIELRGFGIFEVRRRRARQGRNPKSGELVQVKKRYVPFFKVGKEMRQRLNDGVKQSEIVRGISAGGAGELKPGIRDLEYAPVGGRTIRKIAVGA